MSHHLDTPLAAQTGQLFIDDLYVFPGDASTVLVMDVNSDVNGLHSEPGFHPEGRYEFKVHFDGAADEELTYRVSFAAARADGVQALELHTLTGADAREDGAPGELVLRGQTGSTVSAAGRHPAVGREGQRLVLHRPVAAGDRQRRGRRRDRARPGRLEAGGRAEQLRRHQRADDRARGPAYPPAAAAGREDRPVVRDQARDRRRRVAAGEPGRVPDDVADLLARRHEVHQPGQHPAPVAGRGGRRVSAGRARRRCRRRERDGRRPARLRRDRRPRALPGRAAVRGRHPGQRSASRFAMVAPWPTTPPRSCCRWSPGPRCRPGSARRWRAGCARPSSRT